MSVNILDPSSGLAKRRAIEFQDFTAVILVGYGDNLYPFNEGTSVVSKALLPVGNIPIINLVLDWILASGLTDILLIVPPVFHSAISNHLAENFTHSTHPRARIDLKRHTDGEKEDEGETSGMREGTARLLKRFRHFIKSDFVLLPCDLAPPTSMSLSSILDKHRARPAAVLTAVFYEPVEAVRESEEKLLVAIDAESQELLLIQPLDTLEEDLAVRTALLESHPRISLSTRLLDAHIYVCRRTILDLLATRRPKDLDSMKEQVIPWLIKGAWQKGLQEQWSSVLSSRDPLASALARSTTSAQGTSITYPTPPPASPIIEDIETPVLPKLPQEPWQCQVIITAPPTPPNAKAESDYLIRVNSLAGYWELNRRFIRSLAGSSRPTDDLISPSAQISPDSLLGEGTRVGERASVKKCIVGRHCVIGKGAKLTGCILWDFVTVEENTRIENAILCTNVRIGERAQIKDCEFGSGFEAKPGANIKNERLVVGEEA